MQKLFSKEWRIDFFLLLLIVITGAVLRFWDFSESPFTHDEIATVQQVEYPSISDVINKEVKNDVHPAGLFVFVHYWTKLFGNSEQAVKFPFVIFGILSILLVYLIGTHWFSSTVGLMTASLISVIQYTIIYSNIARPYSSGMFFTLLMVWCMIKFFDKNTQRKVLWLCGFVIAATCCTYNHYFSLFFAAIVCATGFFFITRKSILAWCCALMCIALLHLPHLPVFLSQISQNKGVGGPGGWLDKPDSSYLLRYVNYLFHYSTEFLILCLVISLYGIITNQNLKSYAEWRYRIICLLWFAVPFTAGYYYSVKVNPVLQYSGLIFSFSYLLIFLFSFLKDFKPILKISFTVLILLVGTSTLVNGRKHFDLFYSQGINKIISEINSVQQQFGKDSVDIVINVEDYFLFDYKTKHFLQGSSSFKSISSGAEISAFRKAVAVSQKDYFVFASTRVYPLECVEILQEYFPYKISEYKGHLTEIFCFSKIQQPEPTEAEIIFSSSNDFAANATEWKYDSQKVFADSASGKKYYRFDSSDEYGIEFQQPLSDLIKSAHNIIHVSAGAVISDLTSSPLLVMTMEDNGKTLDWRANKFSDYLEPNSEGRVFLSVRFSDIHIDTKNVKLKIYVWNKDHAAFSVNNISVCSKKGNPYFYGLFEEF